MAGKKGRRGPKTPKGRRHQHPHRGGVMRYVYLAASGITKGCLVLCTLAGTLVGTVQAGQSENTTAQFALLFCFDARFECCAVRVVVSQSFRVPFMPFVRKASRWSLWRRPGNIGRSPLRCSRCAQCTGGALGARSVTRHRARAVPSRRRVPF